MRTFVASDIHGLWDRYIQLFDYVTNDDKLYILGDVIDRGRDGIKILQDIMQRSNVELFMGNHELMMLKSICDERDGGGFRNYSIWTSVNNGGEYTYEKYNDLLDEDKTKIISFLENLTLIKRIEINGKKYHLSHSFLIPGDRSDIVKYSDKDTDKNITDRTKENVVWCSRYRDDDLWVPDIFFESNETYIFGHVPVQRIQLNFSNVLSKEDAKMYYDGNTINIDCGCAYHEQELLYPDQIYTCLGLLCLDDMSEIYIH